MKTLKWFREGDKIPDGAVYMGQCRSIYDDVFQVKLEWWLPKIPIAVYHKEYLYEIPVESEERLVSV